MLSTRTDALSRASMTVEVLGPPDFEDDVVAMLEDRIVWSSFGHYPMCKPM
jgi:hypothetical protein